MKSKGISCNFESISKIACKNKKISDQLVDAMLRLANTSPNTEAGVHRYSIKHDMIFSKLWKKPRGKPLVECYSNKVADRCSAI